MKCSDKKSAVYAYEQRKAGLPADYEKQLRKHKEAWAFWQTQPPWYQRNAGYWVASAKREETREKRIRESIRLLAAGKKLGLK